MTNPEISDKVPARDRPEKKKPAYLAGFFGFFFSARFLWGSGGVRSILRSTSSAFGGDGSGFGCDLLMARV
jgi:hypothetical protein